MLNETHMANMIQFTFDPERDKEVAVVLVEVGGPIARAKEMNQVVEINMSLHPEKASDNANGLLYLSKTGLLSKHDESQCSYSSPQSALVPKQQDSFLRNVFATMHVL